MSKTVDAIVLAGGRNSPEMASATGVTNRALVALGEKTMLAHVVTALNDSSIIRSVFVVGDVPTDAHYLVVRPGPTLVDNLLAGLEAAGKEAEETLVVTSDIPFLTPDAVDDFVKRARAIDADLRMPFVSLDACRARYPRMKRTALKLREGVFTLGNMALVRPAAVLDRRETILAGFAARKSIPRLGALLGPGLLLRIVLSQVLLPCVLTVGALEAGVSRLLGCPARGVRSDFPEVGADVDKPEDVALARELFSAQEG